jgi:hypothetical protein
MFAFPYFSKSKLKEIGKTIVKGKGSERNVYSSVRHW